MVMYDVFTRNDFLAKLESIVAFLRFSRQEVTAVFKHPELVTSRVHTKHYHYESHTTAPFCVDTFI